MLDATPKPALQETGLSFVQNHDREVVSWYEAKNVNVAFCTTAQE